MACLLTTRRPFPCKFTYFVSLVETGAAQLQPRSRRQVTNFGLAALGWRVTIRAAKFLRRFATGPPSVSMDRIVIHSTFRNQ